jgi:hypothetical protein
MFEDEVTRVGDTLAALTAALDPDKLSADTATVVFTGLDRIERLAWAGKTLLAPTVAAGHAGQGGGGRTGTDALARHAGTGSGAARDQLATGHALDGLPALAAALRGGHLSATQATLIAAAATADPAAQHRLLALAPQLSVAELRAECARVRAAADPDPDATHRRLRAARRLRRYTDGEGGWNLTARGTPADGAAFNAVLDPLIDAVFRAARATGEHAPFEAQAFDALMALADLAADQPGTPDHPDHPGDPGDPGDPGEPGDPGHAGDEGDHGAPGRPDNTDGPDGPDPACGASGPGTAGSPGIARPDTVPAAAGPEPEPHPAKGPAADPPAADPPAADPSAPPRDSTDPDEADDHDPTPAGGWSEPETVLPFPAEPSPDGPGEPATTPAPRAPTPAADSTATASSPAGAAEPASAPPRPANPLPRRRRRSDPRYLALLRVDLTALHRGRVTGDELCEIAGVGPVPVTVARDLLGDAVLKLVITRGIDVAHVTHLGRGPTAAQRIALAWTSPHCSVLGCPRTRVQIDHRLDWAHTRHTRLDELDPLCPYHHDLKTRHGWALVPGTGPRPFVPPHDLRHARPSADPPSRQPQPAGPTMGRPPPADRRSQAVRTGPTRGQPLPAEPTPGRSMPPVRAPAPPRRPSPRPRRPPQPTPPPIEEPDS